MPADFYKETTRAFGHTTPHFQKSQKTCVANKDRYNSSSISNLVLFSLFATAHEGKNISHKNKSYARSHRGMRLMHDGTASHTARKTVKLVQVNRVNHLAIQITDLNQIDHICPIFGILSAV